MKPFKTLLGLLLASACLTVSAQWQWIDKDGRKVFSDRGPPPDIPEKNIVKRPGVRVPGGVNEGDSTAEPTAAPAAPSASSPKAGVDKELETRKKVAADAELAKKKVEDERIAKAKSENCARAKQAKATLESGVRIGRVTASGEREIMDEAARAVEAKRIQGIMASDCQ